MLLAKTSPLIPLGKGCIDWKKKQVSVHSLFITTFFCFFCLFLIYSTCRTLLLLKKPIWWVQISPIWIFVSRTFRSYRSSCTVSLAAGRELCLSRMMTTWSFKIDTRCFSCARRAILWNNVNVYLHFKVSLRSPTSIAVLISFFWCYQTPTYIGLCGQMWSKRPMVCFLCALTEKYKILKKTFLHLFSKKSL